MHIGGWLRQARGLAGLSLEEATFRLRDVLPRALWVSTKTVHRAESNPDPDPILAAALAHVYGRKPDDWPPELREAMGRIGALGRFLSSAAA